jgi:hypothetical protein
MLAWLYRSRLAVISRRPGARAASQQSVALEGVVILGMHRSGTSLITRLVSLLGLALCHEDDLLVGRKGNPRGHWESRSLMTFNDRLLDELGAAWFCPPSLGTDELSRMLDKHGAEALARLHDTHRQCPWVWKDPRACALLAFWSAVLGQRAAYVLVLRHPLEVADSLARRDGYSPQVSLALWERYTREAMLGAAGRPMMVCTYDEVLADPVGWCERMVAFLSELGLSSAGVDRSLIRAYATSGLRHSHQSWTALAPNPQISKEQVALAELASVFTAQASYVPPALPPETPQTESIFKEIRKHLAERRGDGEQVGLPAHLRSASATGPDAGEARVPVSVVLPRSGADAAASVLTLSTSLPADSEVILVGEQEALTSDLSGLHNIQVRVIECDRPLGEVGALALGAQAAAGEIVLLASRSLTRCDPWYEPFALALAARRVVAVGPVVRFQGCPDRRYYGRVFTDEALTTRFLDASPAKEPVPAALLFAAHAAYNGKVLAAAGGLDAGFDSAQAAVAELSVRLWRMGFHCCIVPDVEVWSEEEGYDADGEEDAEPLYDRLRIASLHFDGARLRAFTDRASRLPAYALAAERLEASDVEQRRAAITAICPFSIERYFERFPLALNAS